jgi:hypothetical protein
MAAAKRTKLEREEQLVEIERMYGTGFSLREIAARFQLSVRVVRRDLGTVAQRYRDSDLSERVVSIKRTMATLRSARREALKAWDRSKEDRVRHVEKKVGDTIRTTIITEQRLGNPEYLSRILKTIRQEAELLGLYPATQKAPTYSKRR